MENDDSNLTLSSAEAEENKDGGQDTEEGDPGEGGSTTQDAKDPWPYLQEYLTFVSSKPSKDKYRNLEYRCTLCKSLVKANSSSRSNLARHFRRQHPSKLKAFEKLLETTKATNQRRLENINQPSVSRYLQREGDPRSVTQATIDNKVLNFIINSSQAFTIVRDEAFQDLIKTLQPRKTVMTYQTFKTRMKEKFEAMLSRVQTELEEANHVCATADIWSDARRSFFGMTAHTLQVVDGSVRRKSYALACKRIKGTHSYDIVAQALMDIMESYNIQYKVSGIVTDNGSNFCKAFKIFSQESTAAEDVNPLPQEEEEEELQFTDLSSILDDCSEANDLLLPPHFRCAAHTLSLVATKDSEAALRPATSEYTKIFRSTFAKLQAVWNLYNRSPKFADFFKAKFQSEKKGLLTPNATRWNSTYDAIKRFKEYLMQDQQAMEALLTEAKVKPLSQAEITFINEFLKVMGPVAEALDYLQGEKFMYLGYLVPTIKSLMRLLGERHDQVLTCKPLARALLKGVRERFSSQLEDKQMIVAAIYLPVFKLDWLHADPEAQTSGKAHLLEEMKAISGNLTSGEESTEQVRIVGLNSIFH